MEPPQTARLLIFCPDQRGIIAAVTAFIAKYNGNILDADQHTDPQRSEFFMRVEVDLHGFELTRDTFEAAWSPVSDQYTMRWRAYWGNHRKRMAILTSREGHCLNDLLWRWRTGELNVDIPCVVSNHPDLRDHVEACGLPYHELPVENNDVNSQEARVLELLEDARVDFVVLARYMRILSGTFVARYPERIINIHHSFLPAFAGPRPYHRAYERGVKIIGATSHYVTEVLDDGPIIAQATLAVDHRDTVADLVRKGRDLERVVLATAVRQHVEDKILVSQNRTIVFD
ncbi:MAG: formyltetrahydrofolate deformylase [Phycisphaerae bacterium]|nr:formyltetrahydrofolate deformylase [Phycisphaerae bacterium]